MTDEACNSATYSDCIVAGIDVSKWQGAVDWAQVFKAGYRFAYVKCSEGLGYRDPRYAENVLGARKAGLLVGAYHFARVSVSPTLVADAESEARWFASLAPKAGPRTLPPMLDLEWDKRARGVPPEGVVEWAKAWLATAEDELGQVPGVYTGRNFHRWKLAKTTELRRHPLWLVQYTTRRHPREVEGWPAVFWQWSHTGRVPGIRGNVDLNRFFGTMADLKNLCVDDRAGVPEVDPVTAAIRDRILGWLAAHFKGIPTRSAT